MDAWLIKKKIPATDQTAANVSQTTTRVGSNHEDEGEASPATGHIQPADWPVAQMGESRDQLKSL